jgi:N-hydroxyarylamine O-acetyltransferase
MLDESDRDRLLEHIALDSPPDADLDGLRAVHRAYVSHVPFENLAVQLGESRPIDPPALVERMVAGGRGGYCFEANTVLLELLESLGFTVTRHEAIVGPRDAFARGEATNHLALVVRLAGGEELIAEGGFGEGPVEPLFLREGRQKAGKFEVGFERVDGGWWFDQHEYSTTPGFRFGDDAVALDIFAPEHLRLSTSPESGFVRTLTVQQPHDDRVVSLRARTLREEGPGAADDQTVLDDADSWASALRERFGIDPDALGPERLARLWEKVDAQHEAFLASRDG